MAEITRFAPSPTGLLHLGHAFSAAHAHRAARESGGRFLLRIEDIDRSRCRVAYVRAIEADLAWLGLQPAAPPLVQSSRWPAFAQALAMLRRRGLLYPCTCTRADIEAAAHAPHAGATIPYPGTCRGRPVPPDGTPVAWRLNLEATGLPLVQAWEDAVLGARQGRADLAGDPVLQRKDLAPAYHLACVLDDAFQGVTLVVRGRDLASATPLQRLLQQLLQLPAPRYLHHRLLLAADGRRLAKRDRSAALASLRADGIAGDRIAAALGAIPPTGADFHWTAEG